MAKYEVLIDAVEYGLAIIEAENEAEAREKFFSGSEDVFWNKRDETIKQVTKI